MLHFASTLVRSLTPKNNTCNDPGLGSNPAQKSPHFLALGLQTLAPQKLLFKPRPPLRWAYRKSSTKGPGLNLPPNIELCDWKTGKERSTYESLLLFNYQKRFDVIRLHPFLPKRVLTHCIIHAKIRLYKERNGWKVVQLKQHDNNLKQHGLVFSIISFPIISLPIYPDLLKY